MAKLCKKQHQSGHWQRLPRSGRTLPPDVRALLTVKDPWPDGDACGLRESRAYKDTRHPEHLATVGRVAAARRKRACEWDAKRKEAARAALRHRMYARTSGPLCAAELETTGGATGALETLIDSSCESLAFVAGWQHIMDACKKN